MLKLAFWDSYLLQRVQIIAEGHHLCYASSILGGQGINKCLIVIFVIRLSNPSRRSYAEVNDFDEFGVKVGMRAA